MHSGFWLSSCTGQTISEMLHFVHKLGIKVRMFWSCYVTVRLPKWSAQIPFENRMESMWVSFFAELMCSLSCRHQSAPAAWQNPTFTFCGQNRNNNGGGAAVTYSRRSVCCPPEQSSMNAFATSKSILSVWIPWVVSQIWSTEDRCGHMTRQANTIWATKLSLTTVYVL